MLLLTQISFRPGVTHGECTALSLSLSTSKSNVLKDSQMENKSMYILLIKHHISVLIRHILGSLQHFIIVFRNCLFDKGEIN